MKFILEDLDFENFLNPIETEWIDWPDAPKYCFKDLAEFKVYIKGLKTSTLVAEYMWRNRNCRYYRHQKKYWDYALEELIKKSIDGAGIYMAGKYWRKDKTDWNKLTDGLIQKDKTGKYISFAGGEWPEDKIDYNKLTDALIEKDKIGKYISFAGVYWPHDRVDYKKLSEALCKINNKKYIEEAKMHWLEFYNCKTGEPIK